MSPEIPHVLLSDDVDAGVFTQKEANKIAEKFGGADVSDYISPSDRRGCDKVNHFLRSLFHSPNHIKHLKEVEGYELRNRPQSDNK